MDTTAAPRPFGAHVRMSWWKPIVIIAVLAIAMVGLQIVLVGLALVVETVLLGKAPGSFTLTPVSFLATNMSLALLAPIAVVLMAVLGKVSWKETLRTGRSFSWRSLGSYAGIFTLLVSLFYALSPLLGIPFGTSSTIVVTGTTLAILVIAVLTTPLQAAAEEIAFRGAVMPAVSSWVRAAKPALVLGLVISSVLFGLSHAAGDPWLIAYYILFGASTATMAVISRGLEAPIAFHVMNNLISFLLGALYTGGGGIEIDRSAGAGGPFVAMFMVMDLLAVGIVWAMESRRRRPGDDSAPMARTSHHPEGAEGADALPMRHRTAMTSSLSRGPKVAEVSRITP